MSGTTRLSFRNRNSNGLKLNSRHTLTKIGVTALEKITFHLKRGLILKRYSFDHRGRTLARELTDTLIIRVLQQLSAISAAEDVFYFGFDLFITLRNQRGSPHTF